MEKLLIIAFLVDGIVFIASVLLQSPKGGGLGLGIGGASAGGNEYGSKKTVESKLQKTAVVTMVIFVVLCIIYPYAK